MARPCSICTHHSRTEIELALVGGRQRYRDIAQTFGVSKSAVDRHQKNHMPTELLRAVSAADAHRLGLLHQERQVREEREVEHAIDVVRQLKAINATCLEVLGKARQSGQDTLSLRAVDRILKQIELQARLLGEIHEGPQVNVLITQEWRQVRAVILTTLEPHPEARNEVIRALQAVADAGL